MVAALGVQRAIAFGPIPVQDALVMLATEHVWSATVAGQPFDVRSFKISRELTPIDVTSAGDTYTYQSFIQGTPRTRISFSAIYNRAYGFPQVGSTIEFDERFGEYRLRGRLLVRSVDCYAQAGSLVTYDLAAETMGEFEVLRIESEMATVALPMRGIALNGVMT